MNVVTKPVSLQVKIEKLVYGGEGLGHEAGSTVFVPYVMPGETVVGDPVESKKKFVRTRLAKILEPSHERIAALCPHFGTCGGCDYQHIPYEAQLRYKGDILRETLQRIGKIEWNSEIALHASPPWAYRNRAQWKIRALERAAGGDGGRLCGIGYFRANSTALCPIDECPVLSPLLAKTLGGLHEAVAAGQLARELREIEAFADSADGRLLLTASFAGLPARAENHATTLRAIVPEAASILLYDPGRDRMHLDGPGFIECSVGGEKYRVGHFSFFQVNRFLVEELASVVSNGERGRLACELFAGVGLFSLPLSRNFERLIAVESNPAAVRDLEANIGVARPIEVRAAAAERVIDRLKEVPDLIVMDPPRSGLAPGTSAQIARLGADRITYVSCEPPTLARDLADFAHAGYEVNSIDLFDLFPQTFHMETVVKLRRSK